MTWDTNGNNNWKNATLKPYLNGQYWDTIDATSQGYVNASQEWKLGGLSYS